ncbi:MAG: dCTP deaminase [Thermoplasmata archaeon]
MILSDAQITKMLDDKTLVIEDYREENLTPNGYDLTIDEISVEGRRSEREGKAVIPGYTWFAVSTKEYVKFPPDVAGELWIRTTWARKGVLASFGMIDAGFEGNLTLSAFNSHKEIEVPIGETFAQMVLHKLDASSEKSYAERSGNYQGQRGVNL